MGSPLWSLGSRKLSSDRHAVTVSNHSAPLWFNVFEGKCAQNPFASSYKIPGGGWLSSAEDMAHFEVAMLNGKLLKRSTRDLMWTPLKHSDGSKDTYGLGWGVGDEDGLKVVGHSGGQQGTSTDFLIAPDKRAGVVVLTNMEEINPNELAVEILKVLVGTMGSAPKK